MLKPSAPIDFICPMPSNPTMNLRPIIGKQASSASPSSLSPCAPGPDLTLSKPRSRSVPLLLAHLLCSASRLYCGGGVLVLMLMPYRALLLRRREQPRQIQCRTWRKTVFVEHRVLPRVAYRHDV